MQYQRYFFVTDRRLLVDRSNPKSNTALFDEYDYKHIAFLQISTSEGSNYRVLGAIFMIIGIVLLAYSYQLQVDYASLIIGGLCFLGGIMALLTSPRTSSRLSIELSGVPKERTYRLDASAQEMLELLAKINENRTRTPVE